jgi:hypothetical protein
MTRSTRATQSPNTRPAFTPGSGRPRRSVSGPSAASAICRPDHRRHLQRLLSRRHQRQPLLAVGRGRAGRLQFWPGGIECVGDEGIFRLRVGRVIWSSRLRHCNHHQGLRAFSRPLITSAEVSNMALRWGSSTFSMSSSPDGVLEAAGRSSAIDQRHCDRPANSSSD